MTRSSMTLVSGGLGRLLLSGWLRRRGVVALHLAGLGRRHGRQGRRRGLRPERLVDLALDLGGDLGVLTQVALHVVTALAHPLVAVGEERARLLDDAVLDAEVEDAALAGDSLAVLDVKLGLAEGSGHLVLDDLHPHAVSDGL